MRDIFFQKYYFDIGKFEEQIGGLLFTSNNQHLKGKLFSSTRQNSTFFHRAFERVQRIAPETGIYNRLVCRVKS